MLDADELPYFQLCSWIHQSAPRTTAKPWFSHAPCCTLALSVVVVCTLCVLCSCQDQYFERGFMIIIIIIAPYTKQAKLLVVLFPPWYSHCN
jgi:hypothetical protein